MTPVVIFSEVRNKVLKAYYIRLVNGSPSGEPMEVSGDFYVPVDTLVFGHKTDVGLVILESVPVVHNGDSATIALVRSKGFFDELVSSIYPTFEHLFT